MANRDELIREFAAADEYRKKERTADTEALTASDTRKKNNESRTFEHKKQNTETTSHRKHGKHSIFKSLVSIITDKTLNKMMNVFLYCLIVNAFEYFVLINRFGIPTRGAIGKVLGILIILGYMYFYGQKLHSIGLNTRLKPLLSGIRGAVLFNLAIIPAYVIECIYYLIKKEHIIIRVFAYTQAYSEVGAADFIANILLLIAINALSAVMLEVLFRGILMKMGKAKFGFWQTAAVVSVFYSLWYLTVPLSKVTAGYSPRSIFSLCIFYLIFEFFISIKWCMCKRATGSIWLSVFDHFIFTTVVGLVRVVNTTPGLSNYIDVKRNYRLIVIQAISFAICYAYYKRKMHRKEKMLQEAGVHSIYDFDSLASLSEEDVRRQAERIKTAEGEIDSTYLRHLIDIGVETDRESK